MSLVSGSTPIVHTHGLNAHRLISALIIAAGVVNIQQVLILGCIAGVTFISAGALVFLKQASPSWWILLFLFLLLIDYTAADHLINPYRVWHYGLFVFALAASVRPLRSKAGLFLSSRSVDVPGGVRRRRSALGGCLPRSVAGVLRISRCDRRRGDKDVH